MKGAVVGEGLSEEAAGALSALTSGGHGGAGQGA